MSKKLLALDQASKITGWAIFEDDKLIDYGKIELDHPDFGVRLHVLRGAVQTLIEENGINEVVMEDIQLQENTQTFKALAEVFGVLTELFIHLGVKSSAVLASSWKSTLGIKGRARAEQKKNAQQYVINKYNKKPTQDICDAICIGLHHIAKRNPNDWTN